ncbi:MAG: SNF2 helicase associated domain-containing protein [Oscillospiraceae bacterium]|nr:SNF2 helicase associated domain-containing protein [Oscillospiraceae bacterium]
MKITDAMIRRIASGAIYSRGNSYFKAGRVHLKNCTDNEINAAVDGGHMYTVQLRINEDDIDYMFCTCPYYGTMNCACKHIVAAAMQYRAEYSRAEISSGNDVIARELCLEYKKEEKEREIFPAVFCLNIHTPGYNRDRGYYSVEIHNGITGRGIDAIKFSDAYISGKTYKLGREIIYSPERHTFTEADGRVMDYIAHIVENSGIIMLGMQPSGSYHLNIGQSGVKRMLEFENANIELRIDGEYYDNTDRYYENPDILVDINAAGNGISLSVINHGTAVVPDGTWFLFENGLYKTDSDFRDWYMPIYNAMRKEKRTQIDFKGDNAVGFVRNILPRVRGCHGVTENGLDETVVNCEPHFSVYFDKYTDNMTVGISAAVRVSYGDISFTVPNEAYDSERILIRDNEREKYILSYFKKFSHTSERYILTEDDKIYDFIIRTLPELLKHSDVYYSDTFKNMTVPRKPEISLRADYRFDVDLLETDIETTLDDDEIRGILAAVREKKKYYRVKDGGFIDLSDRDGMRMLEIIGSLGFKDDEISAGKKSTAKNNMMYLAGLSGTRGIHFGSGFSQMYDRLKNIKAYIPPELEDVLRGYQKAGLDWFTQLCAFGFGGILADDMGLGKTLQVIAFVCSQKSNTPALIVAPSSLIYNWQNEINKFMPGKTSLIIEGKKPERKYRMQNYGDYDFIITSYPLLRRDIEEYGSMEFEFCFIDEAQHIKNPGTMNAASVKRINAKHKFALTGTPIENSLTELWSVFDFLMPGYLYSLSEFTERFEKPVMRDVPGAAERLKEKIAPFLLRRMKNDVLDELPEKVESVIYAELTSEQKKMYAAYAAMAKREFLEMSEDGYAKNKIQILAMLTRLRQICCHPSLFDAAYKKDSGKLLLLEELIDSSLSAGHRVIIFSQFTSMLDIIRARLEKGHISSFYLSGKTSAAERTDMADRFNGGESDVFLISLKAGGTGLNLIGADTVIHYDPWWNPAVTEQASDRVYRIGQTKNVQIIKLVSKGTIEEKIIQLQEKKKSLADGIITAGGVNIGRMSKTEILALLS